MHWLYSFWGSIEFSPNENKLNLWVKGSSTRGEFVKLLCCPAKNNLQEKNSLSWREKEIPSSGEKEKNSPLLEGCQRS